MLAITGAKVGLPLIGDETAHTGVGGEDYVTASAAVAAIGATQGYILFAAKADHAIAAITTANVDSRLIVEHKDGQSMIAR
jgi:hypothetical protein